MNEDIARSDKKTKSSTERKLKTYNYGKFNFLDALIIVAAALLIALLLMVYSPTRLFGFGTESVDIIYTVRVSGVVPEYASSIKIGDTVRDINGYYLGKIASDVEVQEHYVYEYREDEYGNGGIEQIQHPDLVDLVITVSANAEKAADGYYIDGKRIGVESTFDLVLPKLEVKGVCLSLSEEFLSEEGGAR